MNAPTTTAAAQDYLAAVERELADLPVDDRSELLDDLAMHLSALGEEADDRPLTARLGSPTDYAAELRAAAGLPARSVASDAGRRVQVLAAAHRLGDSRAVREVLAFLPQLRPAWWVLRGYLVVLVPRLWHIDGTRDFPVPALLGSHLVGGAAVALAVVISVMIGRRRLPRLGTLAVVALDLAVLLGAVNLLHDAQWRSDRHQLVYVAASGGNRFVDSPLITEAHGPVTNILPFTADGKPLSGVLLFDQDGRPLVTGQQHWFADRCRRVLTPPRAADGTPIAFSYPKQYALDPEGKTLGGGQVTAGQCVALTTPKVPVPVLPTPAASQVPKP
jgi:hypothetical protein